MFEQRQQPEGRPAAVFLRTPRSQSYVPVQMIACLPKIPGKQKLNRQDAEIAKIENRFNRGLRGYRG